MCNAYVEMVYLGWCRCLQDDRLFYLLIFQCIASMVESYYVEWTSPTPSHFDEFETPE